MRDPKEILDDLDHAKKDLEEKNEASRQASDLARKASVRVSNLKAELTKTIAGDIDRSTLESHELWRKQRGVPVD